MNREPEQYRVLLSKTHLTPFDLPCRFVSTRSRPRILQLTFATGSE
jgi:hypothetical protein